MEIIIAVAILAFLLNNILWMYFFYVFTPKEQKREVKLPIISTPSKLDEPTIPDILDEVTNVTLAEVMKGKKEEIANG